MPNRILKESICSSESIDQLTWFEEAFFYRLMVNCDDYGCFDARPAILKARLFPLKAITNKQIGDVLSKLKMVGIVSLYEVDGKPYLQLVTWNAHQQIRAKRRKFPERGEIAGDSICNQMISDDSICTRNPIQSNPNPNPNPIQKDIASNSVQPIKKTKYAENVSMTEEQYNKLLKDYQEEGTKRLIEILDNYKGASGKKYKDDYRAILSWCVKKLEEERSKNATSKDTKTPRSWNLPVTRL